MIVKNEEHIIARALKSADSLFDCACITDTGSDDNTIQEIKDTLEKLGKKYVVDEVPWKNFGYNRTNNIQKAKECFPEVDYYMSLDADIVLDKGQSIDRSLLKGKDKYHTMMDLNTSCPYKRPSYFSSKRDWIYRMPTHEYSMATDTPYITEDLINVGFTHFADGGCRMDKFTRDKKLLLEHLEFLQDPETPKKDIPELEKGRTCYYLANTLETLGEEEEHEKYRILCAKYTTYSEEKYNCLVKLGEMYFLRYRRSDDPSQKVEYFIKAFDYFMEAYKLRLSRPECLRQLGWMFNEIRRPDISECITNFARPATNEALFSDPNVFYECIIENIVSKIRLKKYKEAKELTDIYLKQNLPQYIRDTFVRNSQFIPDI